ncbi:MAG TPA: ABC transporter substrate-binding protein [Thermomicrobiales bacterium]|jgi:peptide/nickel transport system substrate-binding protein|nr:ABC transporter substrate-binding protein [Thermomicrobiales bacterium]
MSSLRPDRDLIADLWAARIDRRTFLTRASAAGLSTAAAIAAIRAMPVVAQDATPAATPIGTPIGTPGATPRATPAATFEPFTSITRDDYLAQLAEAYPREAVGSPGGEIILGLTSDISTLNPVSASDVYSGWFISLLFNTLATTSAIDGTMVPDLADYWERAADGVTYTFHLNRNATWHDGTPVTAADVTFSFDAHLAETSTSPRRSSIQLVLESYRAVDDHTVELTSLGPVSIFLEKSVALVPIIPRHIWESVPFDETFATDPGSTGTDPARVVGSGPFRFTERVEGSYVTISRNDAYWLPEQIPTIDSFTLQVTPEASANIQALQTGQADVTAEVPPAQADIITQSNPDVTVVAYDTTSFNYYTCLLDDPVGSPFFMEKPVRQALMYALDRELISESVYLGFSVPATGSQATLSPAYAPDRITTKYTYDPAMAAQLLDGAGWVMGGDGVRAKDGVRLSFECLYSEGYAPYEQQIPAMQQYWADVGVEMLPQGIPFPTLLDRVLGGDMQMTVLGFSWDFNGDQGDMFRSTAIPQNGFNTGHFANARYDELDAAQLAELDPEARIDILIEQANIVNDEQAVGVMFFDKSITGFRNRVHNFQPNGYSFIWSLPYVWVDPA